MFMQLLVLSLGATTRSSSTPRLVLGLNVVRRALDTHAIIGEQGYGCRRGGVDYFRVHEVYLLNEPRITLPKHSLRPSQYLRVFNSTTPEWYTVYNLTIVGNDYCVVVVGCIVQNRVSVEVSDRMSEEMRRR